MKKLLSQRAYASQLQPKVMPAVLKLHIWYKPACKQGNSLLEVRFGQRTIVADLLAANQCHFGGRRSIPRDSPAKIARVTQNSQKQTSIHASGTQV